jgi:DNA primase large subunit
MRDILDSVKTSHYHVACTRVFEVTHGLKKGEGLGGKLQGENVSHPNSYTERSREMEKEKMAALGQVDQAQGGDVEMAS